MTIRRLNLVAVTVAIVLSCVFLSAQSRSGAQASQPVQHQENARYQIVDGTPELAANIMLLDTWTGESWEVCHNSDGESGWCPMPRFNSPGINSK
jgi:hypothetical protein